MKLLKNILSIFLFILLSFTYTSQIYASLYTLDFTTNGSLQTVDLNWVQTRDVIGVGIPSFSGGVLNPTGYYWGVYTGTLGTNNVCVNYTLKPLSSDVQYYLPQRDTWNENGQSNPLFIHLSTSGSDFEAHTYPEYGQVFPPTSLPAITVGNTYPIKICSILNEGTLYWNGELKGTWPLDWSTGYYGIGGYNSNAAFTEFSIDAAPTPIPTTPTPTPVPTTYTLDFSNNGSLQTLDPNWEQTRDVIGVGIPNIS